MHHQTFFTKNLVAPVHGLPRLIWASARLRQESTCLNCSPLSQNSPSVMRTENMLLAAGAIETPKGVNKWKRGAR